MTVRSEDALSTRNLLLYLGSRFCGGTAMTMLRSAVAWHVFTLTGSAFHLGLIGLVQFLPVLTLTLVGGAVADTYERRRVIMLAQVVPLTCALLLWAATERGALSVPFLYAMVFVAAAASAFENPARAAMLPTLVPRAQFPRAVTLASTGQALAFMSGPASGGLIIGERGIHTAYLTVAVLILGSLFGLAWLRPQAARGERRAMSWTAVREGLAFVRRSPVVLGCMTLDMFAVIFGGAAALLPIYANDILGVGAKGYGVLSASLEAGALATSLVLVLLPPVRRAGRALLAAVVGFGLATIGFGLSTWFPLSIAFYTLCGVADQVSVVMRSTAIQLSTPDALRGRVSAVNFIFIGASNQLGAVESGFVAALTSPVFAVVSGGIGTLIVAALVAWRLPELRRYEPAMSDER
ncbi:MAG: MFS transporter [Deltaproteobacteria bacterium]|nr:MFS transporter [Deltaproteobacteria bacterium]